MLVFVLQITVNIDLVSWLVELKMRETAQK